MGIQKVLEVGVAVAAAIVIAAITPGLDRPGRAEGEAPYSEIISSIEAKLPALTEFETTPDAVVARTHDPATLFEWVRANTTYVAYQGSLRGAAGVLMDRHGNSLDRALLLAHLLDLAGTDARVVTGTLTQGRADLVWNRIACQTYPADLRDVIRQGVLDTLQELVIVLRGDPALPEQTTAALLDEAVRQRIDVMAVRASDDERLALFPARTRALMQNDIDAGFVLVAPSRPVTVDGKQRAAWWRVDTASGHVVGALDSGLLGDDTEYAITNEINGVKLVKFKKPPPSPATRAYMRDLQARKPGLSRDALRDIARLVENYVRATGRLPL